MDIEDKIIAYINGDLTQLESEQFRSEIEDSSQLKILLQEYINLDEELTNIGEEKPSDKLSRSFYQHLESVENNNSNPSTKVFSLQRLLKYAAVLIVVIAASITLWNQIGSDPNIEKNNQLAINEMLSDLKGKSDTEKIEALYISSSNQNKNKDNIIKVLISSLKNDESSHVRLASIETLSDYIEEEQVRGAFIRALRVENDPQVQVALIMALSTSKNKEAIKPLEELINKEDGFKFVKDEAHVGIMKINSI